MPSGAIAQLALHFAPRGYLHFAPRAVLHFAPRGHLHPAPVVCGLCFSSQLGRFVVPFFRVAETLSN